MRFIHTADLHLGASLNGAPYRNRVRRAELGAFQSILRYAETEKIKYIVISGDLFDSTEPEASVLAAVKKMMAESSARFFIAAGNHDPLKNGKYMDGCFSENVYVFGSKAEAVEVEEGSFIGGSLAKGRPHPFRNLPKAKQPSVGVFHGAVGDSSDEYRIEAEDVRRSGLTGLFLGHIHLREQPQYMGGTYVLNTGAVVSHGFDELTVGVVHDVRIQGGIVKTETVPMGPECTVRFGEKTVLLQPQMTQQDVLGTLTATAGEMNGEFDVFRMRIQGETACVIPDKLEQFEGLSEIIDETSLPLSLETEAKEQTLKGFFIKGMLERMKVADPEEKDKLEKALRLGLEALE